MNRKPPSLVELSELGSGTFTKSIFSSFQDIFEPLFKFNELNDVYNQYLRHRENEIGIFDRGLEVLGCRYSIEGDDLNRIPKSGPVLLVANHSMGGIDGLILGSLVDRVRKDGRLLVNSLLSKIRGMDQRCFYVNPFGGSEAKKENLRGIKQSLSWLREGKMLATFPAGEVSHLKWGQTKVTDPQWAENLVTIVRKTGATVVPIYFEDSNSYFFQMMGLIHPRLRTAFLAREMIERQGESFRVRIGNPIAARRLEHFKADRDRIDFLRLRTYILKNREVSEKTSFHLEARKASSGQSIADPVSPMKLKEEIDDLGSGHLLVEQSGFQVYAAKASKIPNVLLELGRLREITFRNVGEGTGLPRDLDRFDSKYIHLFMWNSKEDEIVGAYRLGLTDEILPVEGKRGMYTTTLFKYQSGVMNQLNPGIELGRSFVVDKYQRKPLSLSLIWKGIGTWIAQNPKYNILFGPVSISKEYQSLSKDLIVTYLKEHSLDPHLSSKVRAKRPAKAKALGSLDKSSFKRSVRDIEDVSALISEIEENERGVPVLLRQYLKLNATMLSFNVDPEFNDCIDGLVLVDLTKTEFKVLQKYMGSEGAQRFIDFHMETKSTEVVDLKVG